MSIAPAGMRADIVAADSPWTGTAGRWPLVLYFHHVHPEIEHYTSLTPDAFEHAVDVLLAEFAPLDPHDLANLAGLDAGLPERCGAEGPAWVG